MNRQQTLPADAGSSRTGAAMVFALIALLVATMMIAAMLRLASMSHRQLKRDEFRLQTSLLVDAGFARAAAKLRNQPDFTDEVWNIPSELLTSGRTAKVSLKAIADPTKPTGREVTIVAEYPLDHPDIVRITRVLHIPDSDSKLSGGSRKSNTTVSNP